MEHIFTHYKSFVSNFAKTSAQKKIYTDVKFVANAIKSSKTPNLLKLIEKKSIIILSAKNLQFFNGYCNTETWMNCPI